MLPPDVSSLDVDICDRCNFACIYCYHHDMNGHIMSESTISRILSIIPKNRSFRINFFGGEPLLALNRIKYFVEQGKEHMLSFGLTSNLSKLNPEVVEYMKSNKISIHCSIDGNPTTQNSQRPLQGGQNTSGIVEVKSKLALQISPNDSVRMTIMKKNLKEYFDSVKYVFGLGFSSCAPVLVTEEDWTTEDYNLLEQQLQQVVAWVYEEAVTHNRWRSIKFIEGCKPKRGTQMCGAGMNNIAISLSGDIYPCHRFTRADSSGVLWLGNIHESKWLRTFLERRVLVNALHKNDFEMCLHCPAYESCGGGCPHVNVTSSLGGQTNQANGNATAYLPPYSYCEVKRREHHWGTYLWRRFNNLNIEKNRKLKMAPGVKPSQVGKEEKKSIAELLGKGSCCP